MIFAERGQNRPDLKILSAVIERSIAFLLVIYPVLLLTLKGGVNASFLALLLLSISLLIFADKTDLRAILDRDAAFYAGAMAFFLVPIWLSQSYHHHYAAHSYDAASRYLLAVPVFMLLRRVRFEVIAKVQYGFPLGAIAGLLAAKEIIRPEWPHARLGVDFLNVIYFGDLALMLGILSLFSLNWAGRDSPALRILKVLGFLAGIYASVRSDTRGGWVAAPVFLLIFLYFKAGNISRKSLFATLFIVVAAIFSAYIFNQRVHERVDLAANEIAGFHQGSRDTSIGIRLQLWQAAIAEFRQNPVFGVGPGNFWAPLKSMREAGEITQLAEDTGHAQVHNELLSKLAELGVFGLVSILLIYLVPLKIFIQSARSNMRRKKQSGILGIALVSGFFIFGLTVEILDLTMTAAFYSLTVAVFLAASLNLSHGEQQPVPTNNP